MLRYLLLGVSWLETRSRRSELRDLGQPTLALIMETIEVAPGKGIRSCRY